MTISPDIHIQPGCISKLNEITAHRQVALVFYHHAPAELILKIRTLLAGTLLTSFRCPAGLLTVEIAQAMQRGLWRSISGDIPLLIAIGGGSTIDLAKAMRFKFPPDLPFQDCLDKPVEKGVYESCPLIAIPTTAGTGSEVSPTATIWNPFNGKKHSLFGPAVTPDMALIDPELCLGTPWEITRDSALDALSHALESIWNIHSTSETDRLAIAAARTIIHNLPMARLNPTDRTTRIQLSQAALDAGKAMALTQTAIVHALSYDDTLVSGLSHGHACARWLPAALHLAKKIHPEVGFKLDQALGADLCEPDRLFDWLVDLGYHDCVPANPTEEDMEKIQRAIHTTRGKNFIRPTHHEIESI